VTAAARYVGPAVSVLAVLTGVAVGRNLGAPEGAWASGVLWASGVGLLVAVAVLRRAPGAGAWVVPALAGYALLLGVVQPSARHDGNAAAAVWWSVVWLVPAVAGGVALPRAGRWEAAAGCWLVVLGLSMAAACTAWHRNACIGLFTVVWD
jgi:hypothetical protein